MISSPHATSIWIAAGVTDMRRGFTGLSAVALTVLEPNPYSGHVFVFRGKRGDLIKVLWWDGDGLCLFAKRLEGGRFLKSRAALDAASKGSTDAGRYEPPRHRLRYRTSFPEMIPNLTLSLCRRDVVAKGTP